MSSSEMETSGKLANQLYRCNSKVTDIVVQEQTVHLERLRLEFCHDVLDSDISRSADYSNLTSSEHDVRCGILMPSVQQGGSTATSSEAGDGCNRTVTTLPQDGRRCTIYDATTEKGITAGLLKCSVWPSGKQSSFHFSQSYDVSDYANASFSQKENASKEDKEKDEAEGRMEEKLDSGIGTSIQESCYFQCYSEMSPQAQFYSRNSTDDFFSSKRQYQASKDTEALITECKIPVTEMSHDINRICEIGHQDVKCIAASDRNSRSVLEPASESTPLTSIQNENIVADVTFALSIQDEDGDT